MTRDDRRKLIFFEREPPLGGGPFIVRARYEITATAVINNIDLQSPDRDKIIEERLRQAAEKILDQFKDE